MMRQMQRMYCLFAGHQYWLGRGTDRLYLKCSACGRETAGIPVGGEAPPRRTTWWRRGRGRQADGDDSSQTGPGSGGAPVTADHRR